MKIGTVTLNWNREKYLVPHLRQFVGIDRSIVLQAEGPWISRASLEDTEEDLSVHTVQKYLPNVEIYRIKYTEFDSGILNSAVSKMQDCDMVLKLDSDMFFTKKDWKKLIDFIKGKTHECYRLNYNKHSVNYGADWLGVINEHERDIIAFSPKSCFTDILSYQSNAPCYTIDGWKDFTVHHIRGGKYGINHLDAFIKFPSKIRKDLKDWEKVLKKEHAI